MRLTHVDPLARKNTLQRQWERLARTPFGRWYDIHLASPVDAMLLRASGGRLRLVGPLPTATLTTTGARSGRLREVPVVYFHDDSDVIVVASSFGRDRHPAWYHNLVAHPDCRLNDLTFTAAEVTDPDDYERLFGLAERVYAGYADYRARTDAIGRHIPVLRLTPA